MIVFFHFHKCAGTSVVDSAVAAGLTLPPSHENGHPKDEYGAFIEFDNITFERLSSLFQTWLNHGVQFVALEWSFPPIELLVQISGLTLCTVIRDPFARMISNFKMDVAHNWLFRRVYSLEDYMDSSVNFRSDNYYIKIICGLSPENSVIKAKHINYAQKFFEKMDFIEVLERKTMSGFLEKIGIDQKYHKKSNVADAESTAFNESLSVLLKPELLGVEQNEFIERNLADYFIYHNLLAKTISNKEVESFLPLNNK